MLGRLRLRLQLDSIERRAVEELSSNVDNSPRYKAIGPKSTLGCYDESVARGLTDLSNDTVEASGIDQRRQTVWPARGARRAILMTPVKARP